MKTGYQMMENWRDQATTSMGDTFGHVLISP